MSELSTTARQHLDTIGRAFAGIAEFDADKMLENYSDDLVLEVPYADPPLMLDGKPTILKFLRGAFKIFHFSIDVTDVYEVVDPTMLILEYKSKGTTKATMARSTAMISAGIAQMMRKAAVSRFTDSSYSRL